MKDIIEINKFLHHIQNEAAMNVLLALFTPWGRHVLLSTLLSGGIFKYL